MDPRQQQINASELFDAGWYARTYPDVGASGIDPAAHYLRYGLMLGRDPGPDMSLTFLRAAGMALPDARTVRRLLVNEQPETLGAMVDPQMILWAADRLMAAGQGARAVYLARRWLPADMAHAVLALQANLALADGDRAGWLRDLNRYLAHYGTAPVKVGAGGDLLQGLTGAGPLAAVTGGPKISVIMPVWNGAATVAAAARSILRQSWRNLELLIVDDASSDDTWAVVQALAATDGRVRVRRNRANVGPYVSKNIALRDARGEYVTGQDADDWAHPDRLARHVAAAVQGGLRASQTLMVRVRADGAFSQLGRVRRICPDGVARIAPISCLFERALLTDTLGYWDSVRFGADSEMVHRAEAVLGVRFATLPQIGMICLDLEGSLTNHPEFGNTEAGGISDVRAEYRRGWKDLLATGMTTETAYRPFPPGERLHPAAAEMLVSLADIESNLAADWR